MSDGKEPDSSNLRSTTADDPVVDSNDDVTDRTEGLQQDDDTTSTAPQPHSHSTLLQDPLAVEDDGTRTSNDRGQGGDAASSQAQTQNTGIEAGNQAASSDTSLVSRQDFARYQQGFVTDTGNTAQRSHIPFDHLPSVAAEFPETRGGSPAEREILQWRHEVEQLGEPPAAAATSEPDRRSSSSDGGVPVGTSAAGSRGSLSSSKGKAPAAAAAAAPKSEGSSSSSEGLMLKRRISDSPESVDEFANEATELRAGPPAELPALRANDPATYDEPLGKYHPSNHRELPSSPRGPRLPGPIHRLRTREDILIDEHAVALLKEYAEKGDEHAERRLAHWEKMKRGKTPAPEEDPDGFFEEFGHHPTRYLNLAVDQVEWRRFMAGQDTLRPVGSGGRPQPRHTSQDIQPLGGRTTEPPPSPTSGQGLRMIREELEALLQTYAEAEDDTAVDWHQVLCGHADIGPNDRRRSLAEMVRMNRLGFLRTAIEDVEFTRRGSAKAILWRSVS